ncbi:hypothetical protein WN48_07410 [Eufriesea mexicana]|uniref:Uncharacterized protein n=1 Tax=Eufriesea mexicana TaxID=516756 RepID=A0A310SHH9_9HYME|nr:hypothetical protein WN48_07410 [Eufriesea mexicana]
MQVGEGESMLYVIKPVVVPRYARIDYATRPRNSKLTNATRPLHFSARHERANAIRFGFASSVEDQKGFALRNHVDRW